MKKKKRGKKTVDSVALSLNRNTICCIGSITSSTTQNTSSSEANKIERQMKKKTFQAKCVCVEKLRKRRNQIERESKKRSL